MSHPRRAVLAGATGLVGGYCLGLLLADPTYQQITALSRRPLSSLPAGADLKLVDFERLEPDDIPTADDLFCCLGTTIRRAGSKAAFARVDLDYVQNLAEAAIASEISQFILVSAVGADPGSSIFYNRVKGRAEAAVSALPFRSVHLIRPSLLLGRRSETRPREAAAQRIAPIITPFLRGRLQRYRPIQAAVVADAMIQLAKRDLDGVHMHELGAWPRP